MNDTYNITLQITVEQPTWVSIGSKDVEQNLIHTHMWYVWHKGRVISPGFSSEDDVFTWIAKVSTK
jgi:hypothetical protein